MKNIEELWQYVLKCPTCPKIRNVKVNLHGNYTNIKFIKNKEILTISG
jgi:hypothetical protein